MPSFRKVFFWLILFLTPNFHLALKAQQLKRPGLSSVPTLGQLVRKAGYVFDGTVLSVVRFSQATHEVPTVQIRFRVERGIRGAQTGKILTVREWAGLWDSGERYRPGERVVLFLYPPSKLGVTSPVAGALGRFGVDAKGFVKLQPGRVEALSAGASTEARVPGKHRLSASEFVRAIQKAEVE